MRTRLENAIMLCPVPSESDRITPEITSSRTRVDLDIFGAKEIRDVLKSRAHCLRAGFSVDHVIITTLNDIRDYYILKVGLPTYLSQMLGEVAKAPLQNCTLYDSSDQPIKFELPPNRTQPLQRFIAHRFQWDELPFKVEVRKEGNPEKVETRYL